MFALFLCFLHTVVYEEMEDDGLHIAFSPAAIPCKVQAYMGAASTSKQSPIAVVKPDESRPKTDESRPKTDVPRRRRRKHRFMEEKQESLEEFLSRRKKTKKENKAKRSGFQHMITDYFKHTKMMVKTERKEVQLPAPSKDILQNVQYDFDRSQVPEDDDVQIVEVIPGRNTADNIAKPFVYKITDEDEEMAVKKEPKHEPMDLELVAAKVEPEPGVTPNSEKPVDAVTTPTEPDVVNSTIADVHVEEELKDDAVSLESAREDNLDDGDKVSERETLLLQKVESLSRGLEEMKNQMRRERRATVTKSLASKLRQKMLKTKATPRKPKKPIFEKVEKSPEPKVAIVEKHNSTPAPKEAAMEKDITPDSEHKTPEPKVLPPAEVQQSHIEWEEVQSSKVNILSTEDLVSDGVTTENKSQLVQNRDNYVDFPLQILPDVAHEVEVTEKQVDVTGDEPQGTQLTASEALNFLCGSENLSEDPADKFIEQETWDSCTDANGKSPHDDDRADAKVEHSYAAGDGNDSGHVHEVGDT